MSLLHLDLPVVAAPMAGGPSRPALVAAASSAGGLGFLAAGYKTPPVLAAELASVRGASFGVNVFVPAPTYVDPAAFRAYAASLGRPDASWVEDDDAFAEKVELLMQVPVPVVTFTFALPGADVVRRLRAAGSVVGQTVTSPAEAVLAEASGVGLLVVQGAGAGGHSGTFTPASPPPLGPLADLVRAVRAEVNLPVVAAGGVADPTDVRDAVAAGAEAVAVGTLLLRTPEAGTSAVHRTALAAGGRETVVTHAFSGRPARALRNGFVEAHDAEAPLGYPAVHHLTSPLRKAAAEAGDAEGMHLWAGIGYESATDDPAADVLTRLGELL